jgi:hypothetical protein
MTAQEGAIVGKHLLDGGGAGLVRAGVQDEAGAGPAAAQAEVVEYPAAALRSHGAHQK